MPELTPQPMIEIMRTNDLVLISFVEATFGAAGLRYFVADGHMSALEGSLGFLPRRILVEADDAAQARRLLVAAGLEHELRGE
jgi:uncharacterized protein (DUF1330 family)